MNALELISKLRAHNVLPKLVEGKLKLSGNTGELSPEFLSELKENKQLLLDFLLEREAGNEQLIESIEYQESYPMTNAQQRIWVLCQFEGGNEAYNITDAFYLKGTLDLTLFEKAFQLSIKRHESLRTSFAEEHGTPVQKIHEVSSFTFETIHLFGATISQLKEIVNQFNVEKFELDSAPLFKVKMLKLSDSEYAMLFNMHHIIGDGWSLGVLLQEVMGNYRKLCLNVAIDANPLAIQFKDYAAWLTKRISGSFGERSKQFWSTKQLGTLEPLQLPTDFPRSEKTTFAGASHRFSLRPDYYTAIEDLAKKNQTTIFNIYRSILNIVLHKWTNQTTLAIGTPVAGRTSHQLNEQIGLYVNTVPLVSEYLGSSTFSEYVRIISEDSLTTLKFQDYPLDLLIEEHKVKREAGRNPIFDVLMIVQNTAIGDGSIDSINQHGFTFNGIYDYYNESIASRNDVSAKFDLCFCFSADSTDDNFLEIECKTDLFRKSTIQGLFNMFILVSEQILENNLIELKDIEIIDVQERTKVLEELNQPIGFHSEENILDLILSDFQKNANHTAIIDDENELSYADLDVESNQIGAYLESNGDERVGLFLSRSTKIVSSVLGIWKSGKAYVPIDIKYPAGRIQYIIEDSAVQILLVDNESATLVPESFQGSCINLDTLERIEEKGLTRSSDKDSVAYLIYTSGSTGQPKGVEITHRNVIAFLKWSHKEFGNTMYDVMFAGTSYCFDLSVFEMLLPLSQGKKIRILDSGVDIPNYLDAEKKIFINTVPSVVRSLLDQQISWDNVVALNMAGEPVPKIFKDLLDYSAIEIRNLYGPSEDTTYSTMYRFSNDNLSYIPIGVPVGDTHAYILDEDLNILPIGVEGEICLSGQSIAKGYLNKADLTTASFIENPFVSGQRMYRTGDIGKWTEEKQLAFTGRKDDQVKVRGFRIELGEIQYQLDCIEDIEQAVAIVKDVNAEKAIIAYYKTKSSITELEISSKLALHLPAYMTPAFYVKMEEIPMNSNGKVDKKQLPDPDVVDAKEIIAPKTETQNRLLKLWEQALNTTGFGIESNFFELGGHSLKATKLRSLILAEFQKDITLNELFEHPEIPNIAELIETKPVHTERKVVKTIKKEDTTSNLSFAQERLWVLTRFENATRAYHMPAAFKITGNLNGQILETAVLHVIDRHESLRTLFKEKLGVPYQHIVTTKELSFALEYLKIEADDSLEDYLKNNWAQPFDLENGPLLRCTLIERNDETFLSFNMHHIISDGWSIGVLFQDVMKSYAQITRGDSGALSPLDVQYKDFSEWQRNELNSEQRENQLNYWKNEVFDQEIKPLELPYDQLRPEIKTYNGSTYKHVLSKTLSENIVKQASELGVSLYMSIMTNVSVLLKKLGNQSDLVIGTPVSGREMTQLQQQIGFYVNTLPIRIKPNGEKLFRSLLAEVREHLLSAFNHQHFPFEMLVEAVQPKRDLSRSPFFDVMVVMQNFDIFENSQLQLDEEIQFNQVEVSSGNAKYDLTFSFSQQENRIHLDLEYNTDLFHKSTIERIVKQFQYVFEQTSSNVEIQISKVSLVSSIEQQKLLAKSDFTNVAFDKTQTIISHFNEAVTKYPNHAALKVEERTWTYRELDEKSGQLARILVEEYQVNDEDLVVLHTDRNEWMIISILACLKAGAAYVPVDPSYPASRIEYILSDSGSQLILADNALPSEKEYLFEKTNWLNVLDVSFHGVPFVKALRPEQLAYIIYTSGTTGNPKGVLIEHRHVSRLLFNKKDYFDFNENDSWTLFHSYCFDFSVWEMYGALLKGGKLVMVPKVIAQDGASFFQFLHDEKITVLNQTPTAFRSLCLINEANFAVTSVDVRYVIFGGEALMPSTLKGWHRNYPTCKLINMYGITETTVHVTYKEIGAKEIEANKSNIGVPISTLSCFVLDEDFAFCVPGVIGELCVGGAGVARGYHNKPELTAEKFVKNPFGHEGNLYRSGDFARLLENGDIEYIGRKDEQVKIRGHRIELPEVEEGLKRLVNVDDAVVLATKNQQGEFELTGYVIAQNPDDFSVSELRKKLHEELPSYMIPSFFVPLSEFPLTSNGKLDKKKLPLPDRNIQSERIQPETELESILFRIWSEVLNIENFGVTDNFFELGGHSLKATRVRSLIAQEIGKDLTINEIFLTPTIQGQVQLLEAKGLKEREVIKVAAERSHYPVSFTQERLWVLTQFEEASKAYHMPAAFKISGELNIDRLQAAVNMVVEKHESLRTVFRDINGTPSQLIQSIEEAAIEIEQHILNSSTESLNTFLISDWQRPFNLKNGPLLRCSIIKTNTETILSFNMHHIISDGWSIGVLFSDVTKAYSLLMNEDHSILSPLEIQFKDFAVWQRNYLTEDKLQEQVHYWKETVFHQGISTLELPTDFHRPEVKTYNGSTLHHTFSKKLTAQLIQSSHTGGASLFMSLMANVSILMKKLANQSDITIGTPVAGRDTTQLQHQIGFFVNTLPIRTEVHGNLSYQELLANEKANILKAFEYQYFPFELLVQELQSKRDFSRSPLFDVMVVLHNTDILETDQNGFGESVTLEKLDVSSGITKYDLIFSFTEYEDQIHLELDYNTDLFIPKTIERYVEYLQVILETTTVNESILVSDINIQSTEEQAIILSKGDRTNIRYNKQETIVSLFEKSVNQFPDNTAFKVGEKSFSYAELDEKSGQLARILKEEHQVQAEDLIVLHTDRSEWMIIAILGVLKAGAAYVPIDPTYPASRIEYILTDSQSKMMLFDGELSVATQTLLPINTVSVNLESLVLEGETYSADLQPNHLAYVIYTSGTTGNPKGVLIEHRNVNRLLFNDEDLFDFNEGDVWSLFHSYCFDFSVWEMYGALLKGGTLVMVPKEVAQDSSAFFDFLNQEKITVLNQTPTAFRSLSLVNNNRFDTTDLAVRYVIFGGEALMPEILEPWKKAFAMCKLINMYGITETTVHVTYKEITENEIQINKSLIGEPIPTLSCYVLDQDLKPVTIGVVGELCVGGAGVARGYHNRPDLTAEKFVPNPFCANEKIYRSGDYARILQNGEIEYIGRKDEQVKIRGHRIEIGEIEAALLKLPEIEDVVVLATKNQQGEFDLTGYVISQNPNEFVATDLRGKLQEQLPSYMIPSFFVSLVEFPLTSNGKLDKKALLEVSGTVSSSVEYVAPQNEVQEAIVEIWEDVLGKTRIGIRDNFFDLGGHSLKATRVISKIQEIYGVKIDLGSLFIDPTVASLSEHVTTLTWMSEEEKVESGGEELII